jgi:hypothetical protein
VYYSKVKILLARCFVYNGLLKKKLRKLNISVDLSSNHDSSIQQDNQVVTEYIKKLNVIIEKSIMPIPKRLDSFEKAIAIITSVLPKISPKNPLYLVASVEMARARRYLAESKS